MRIVCPKCVAQYEVDESAIPKGGREVQCAHCEHIWFQDYLVMLPDRPKDDPELGPEIFEDLDGVGATEFHSSRADPAVIEDDASENILSDDFDLEDDAPSSVAIPPVADEVREVLQSEAAFSSARAKIDAAASATLDGRDIAEEDLEEPEDAAEDAEAAVEAVVEEPEVPETEVQEPVAETAEPEPNLDELAAFLDAHSDPEPTEIEDPAPEPEIEPEDVPEPEAEVDEDPLADLAAMRAQLDNLAEPDQQDDAPEYTPVVPQDDPVEDVQSDEPEPVADVYDEDEDDALDEDQPRHAFRSDRADAAPDPEPASSLRDGLQDDLTVEAAKNEPEGLTEAIERGLEEEAAPAAAATLSMSRPRSTGRRARSFPGMEPPAEPEDAKVDAPAEVPKDDMPTAATAALMTRPKSKRVAREMPADTPAETRNDSPVDTPPKAERPEPAADRSELLGDVEELSDSLGTGAEPRPRDPDLMEAHEAELAAKSSGRGFRRAFIWTIFIIALLLALYVLRPQIVGLVPAAALVLDPYAALIDSVRLAIQGLIG